MNKKLYFKILFFIFVFISLMPNIYSLDKTGIVDADNGLILRKGPGTTYSKVTTISLNKQVTIKDTKSTDDKSTGCPSGKWYYITYSSYTGYVCTNYVIVNETNEDIKDDLKENDISKMTDEEFDKYLDKQGFPDSYKTKLKSLHTQHPNWVFIGINAQYTWANALSQENYKGRSLLQVTASGVENGLQGYLNTGSDYYDYTTDKFVALDGSTWFQASNETIAYYMDPRNFLTESKVFMFEDLKYYPSYQNDEVVKKILYTDFYKDYIGYYIQAAESYDVSPVYLASLTRQEVGLEKSTATSGKAGTYDGVNYDGYYNFYNIGATAGKNPVYNGLAYAKEAGWTSVKKAITGGAKWIVNGYINDGQYTQYFQKWNTSPDTSKGIWHQYMSNIKAVASQSSTTLASYKTMKISNEPFVFSIPIYIGMPSSTSLPKTGNPNNYLKSLKVDGTSVDKFAGKTTSYTLKDVDYSKTSIKISATTVNSNASIDGDGTVNLAVGQNKISIKVTAQNGAKKTYTINITRKEKTIDEKDIIIDEANITTLISNYPLKSNDKYIYGFKVGTKASEVSKAILNQNANSKTIIKDANGKEKTSKLFTGDKITITSANETKTFEVIIFGDIDGNGDINAKDLLKIRKHLLKQITLKNSFLEAAKMSKTGNDDVTAKDLLVIRKYLLNKGSINQL